MRLIDADAAIDALDSLCDRVCQYSKKQRAAMCGACPLGSAFDVIEELPSAQPEQKPGKWIKPTGMMPPEYAGVYRCSECGSFAMRDWKTHKQTLTDYCPSCGARMESE